ncbi:MAG: two-component system sensor histidine kinase/response regulator [Candidatus Azotimanducaceae bacterium]|jgi:two-component system sensor histidine kinase/response regulator
MTQAQRPQKDEHKALVDIMSAVDACVFQADWSTGRVIYASEQIKSITGYPADYFETANHVFGLGVGSDKTLSQLLKETLGPDDRWNFDFEIEHCNGGRLWINFRGKLQRDASGGIALVNGLILDVSQRKTNEELNRILTTAVTTSGHEVVVYDADSFSLVYANETALTNLGYGSGELFELATDVYFEDGLVQLRQLKAQISEERPQIETGQLLRRKDGSEYNFVANVTLQLMYRPLLVLIGKDSTSILRLKKLEEELRGRYRRAMEGSDTDIWEWDIKNNTFNTTSSVARWLDIPAMQLSGEGDLAVSRVHPADKDRVLAKINAALKGRDEEYNDEYRLIGAEDRIVWILSRGRVYRDDSGTPLMMSGTTTNVSAQKDAQREIQDHVTTIAAVLNNVADGIVAMHADGRLQSVNPRAQQLLKSSEEDLIGQEIHSAFMVHGAPITSWASVADGTLREASLRNEHGMLLPIEFAVSEARLVDDKLYILVFRGITGRKRFEREILAAKERAENAAKIKTEFLATMSHEIRTPMNGILGMAQLLLDTDLSDEQQETARIIHSSGDALLTIINDILDFSKIDAGKLEVESEPFDLRIAISEVFEIMQSKSNEADVPLLVDYPLETAHLIHGDAGRVRQILLNLVGNAVKFTETGKIDVRVRAVTEAASAGDAVAEANAVTEGKVTLEISVCDTGIGIPEDIQESLFESFSQADVSTTRKYGGTGLGLAICKRLTELMGGNIGVESSVIDGTRFWFRLQFLTDAAAIDPKYAQRFEDVSALVCFDNTHVAESLVEKLVTLGVSAARLDHLDDAVLEIQRPGTLVFLPDSVSTAALQDLRQKIQLPFSEVVLTSVWSKQRSRLLDLGCRYFLSTPVGYGNLIAELQRTTSTDTKIENVNQHEDSANLYAGVRVLLAEDNIVNQKVITRMLTRMGCRVDIAANGIEAIEMWNSLPYNMIFMDCRMPEKDGWTTATEIRDLETEQHMQRIPIVAMTANVVDGDRDACIDAGMDDYVAKPVNTNILSEVMRRWAKSV